MFNFVHLKGFTEKYLNLFKYQKDVQVGPLILYCHKFSLAFGSKTSSEFYQLGIESVPLTIPQFWIFTYSFHNMLGKQEYSLTYSLSCSLYFQIQAIIINTNYQDFIFQYLWPKWQDIPVFICFSRFLKLQCNQIFELTITWVIEFQASNFSLLLPCP